MNGCVASIGFFDGVHRGHQCLIRQVQEEARRRGAHSLLITFDRHPRAVFAPESVPPLLTTAAEKMTLLRATGMDGIYTLPFDHEMASLTAREFMQHVLRDKLGVKALVIGYDHHFGRPQSRGNNTVETQRRKAQGAETQGTEGFEEYLAYGRELGVDVLLAHELEGEHISSSVIRHALENGDVSRAAHLLGRPYTWTGRVVHGHAVGRQLGFPTANLEALSPEKQLPANGVYAVLIDELRLNIDKKNESTCCMHQAPIINHQFSILNIGCRPTINNGYDTSIEAHLLDFEGDLYGQTLTVSFIARLRAEQRFASEEELARQLQHDREAAQHILAMVARKQRDDCARPKGTLHT